MEPIVVVILALAVLVGGFAIGWLLATRQTAPLRVERDDLRTRVSEAEKGQAAADERAKAGELLRMTLSGVTAERDTAHRQLAEMQADARHFEEQKRLLLEAQDSLKKEFENAGSKVLEKAQEVFLSRAKERFDESEKSNAKHIETLLAPVNERLKSYEEQVATLEAKRVDAFGQLHGQIEQMRIGQEKVSAEAAKLVNSLRNAPKSRGRWGEQQLRNVLETCGLSEHADFQAEVSVESDEGGRLRPDAIVRVPGGRALVIDAKVSLNAYQDAFGAADETERQIGLAAHAAAMRAHVNGLGNKAYWSQFEDAPDYVIMFVPGEHFLSAALEHDPTLWDFAFDKRVLLATPTNLIAIARTVAAVWRQERLALEARQIGALGKELYDRLAKAVGDLRVVGSGLNTAVKNFNTFASSLESRALVSARKLRDMNIEPGAREIETIAPVELLASHGDESTARPEAAE